MNNKILMIILPLMIIVAVAVGIGSYRANLEVQKLPANSIKIIRESVDANNFGTFKKLVDIDAVLDTAAEEIATAYLNDSTNSMTYSTLEMQNRYAALREDFLAATKVAVKDYVAQGQINFPAELTPAQQWLKDSGVDSCAIKNYSKPVINEGVARTKITFYNVDLRFEFELEVALKKITESTWQVVSAKGFDKFFRELKRAQEERLKDLNAPVQAEIEEFVALKSFDASVEEGDEYGFSKTLKLTVNADIFADKPIEKIGGRVIIDGRDDKSESTPFEVYEFSEEDGAQIFIVNKTLNPFVKVDADVMRHGLKKRDIHIEVTEIIFSDGTSLKKLDELPK